jgi:hypothetical protein
MLRLPCKTRSTVTVASSNQVASDVALAMQDPQHRDRGIVRAVIDDYVRVHDRDPRPAPKFRTRRATVRKVRKA